MFANVCTFLLGKSALLTSNKTIWGKKCLQTITGNALKVQLNIFEPPTLPRLVCILKRFKSRLFATTGHALLK